MNEIFGIDHEPNWIANKTNEKLNNFLLVCLKWCTDELSDIQKKRIKNENLFLRVDK